MDPTSYLTSKFPFLSFTLSLLYIYFLLYVYFLSFLLFRRFLYFGLHLEDAVVVGGMHCIWFYLLLERHFFVVFLCLCFCFFLYEVFFSHDVYVFFLNTWHLKCYDGFL